MEPENNYPSICCLPDEIIVIILQKNDYRDLIHFSMTCKRYNELVNNSNVLWKNNYKKIHPEMMETIHRYGSGNWYKEVKQYYVLKNVIYASLNNSCNNYYGRIKPVHFMDVCSFMNVYTTTKNANYYYTVNILQDIIKKTCRILNTNTSKPPYTLTHMYYAKTALRYYFHAYLALKWNILCSNSEKPPPYQVVNFFVQWIYNTNLEADELADKKISALADKVDDYLKYKNKGVSVTDPSVRLADKVSQVLRGVTHVLYRQRHIVSGTETANFETLDIAKVLDNKLGHHIVILAIYQAVAAKLGVFCELHVFPNHLYLEWRDNWDDPRSQGFIVDVDKGVLKPKGGCPFSRNPTNSFRYNHNILIECLYMEFHRTMGYINDWHTQNCDYLTEFLGMGNDDLDSVYKNISVVLLSHKDFPVAERTPLELKFLSNIHLDFLNEIFRSGAEIRPFYRDTTIKIHPSCIRFAIGMICMHKTTHFNCVILGYTENHNVQSFGDEIRGPCTRYYVIDIDKSTRYIAQEHLVDLKRPSRLTHLEDELATEFTHFDGFRYVPNAGKRAEFPHDDAIALMYKTRAGV